MLFCHVARSFSPFSQNFYPSRNLPQSSTAVIIFPISFVLLSTSQPQLASFCDFDRKNKISLLIVLRLLNYFHYHQPTLRHFPNFSSTSVNFCLFNFIPFKCNTLDLEECSNVIHCGKTCKDIPEATLLLHPILANLCLNWLPISLNQERKSVTSR